MFIDYAQQRLDNMNRINPGFNFRFVMYQGNRVSGYYVNKYGEIYSHKQVGLKKLKIAKGCKHNPYPKVGLSIEGKSKTLMVHRLVCETFHEKPMPEELRGLNWNNIPDKERKILQEFVTHADRYQVNHIDHDHNNFHPSNLEWVTVKENQQKYQEHKLKVA
jgi:hypothetical protein